MLLAGASHTCAVLFVCFSILCSLFFRSVLCACMSFKHAICSARVDGVGVTGCACEYLFVCFVFVLGLGCICFVFCTVTVSVRVWQHSRSSFVFESVQLKDSLVLLFGRVQRLFWVVGVNVYAGSCCLFLLMWFPFIVHACACACIVVVCFCRSSRLRTMDADEHAGSEEEALEEEACD